MPKGVNIQIIGANKIEIGTKFIDVYITDETSKTLQIKNKN